MLTAKEASLLLDILNRVPVTGTQGIREFIALVEKLEGMAGSGDTSDSTE
jgi:hypothetical protein